MRESTRCTGDGWWRFYCVAAWPHLQLSPFPFLSGTFASRLRGVGTAGNRGVPSLHWGHRQTTHSVPSWATEHRGDSSPAHPPGLPERGEKGPHFTKIAKQLNELRASDGPLCRPQRESGDCGIKRSQETGGRDEQARSQTPPGPGSRVPPRWG